MPDIYDLLVRNQGTWVNGKGFHALNYGKDYSSIRGNVRKVGIVSSQISYLTLTPEKDFPQDAFFEKREPNMALTEASHVGNMETVRTGLTLEKIVKILKQRGIRFED